MRTLYSALSILSCLRLRRPEAAAHVLLFLLITTAAGPTAGAELRFERTTENYLIQTDVSAEFADLTAAEMEYIYEEYSRVFDEYERISHEPINLKVFSSRSDYNDAVPPEVRNTAGAFITAERLIAAFKEDRTREDVLRTLYHEGFHQFLDDHIEGRVPLWANEGFAEYFAEANWDGTGFSTGQVPWERLHVLQPAIEAEEHIPLEELFVVEGEEWLAAVQEDYSRANLQYSQAWSVIHFLVHAGRGRFKNRLFDYLEMVSRGESREKATSESFGEDIDRMEDAWKGYVLGLSPDRISSCRHDMELLLFLAASFYDSPGRMRSMEKFSRDVIEGRRTWSITAPDGERITSDDKERIEEMMRCPANGGSGASSYVLLLDRQGDNLPEIYCLHHDGVLIQVSLVRDNGRWRASSQVLSRRAFPDELLESIKDRK